MRTLELQVRDWALTPALCRWWLRSCSTSQEAAPRGARPCNHVVAMESLRRRRRVPVGLHSSLAGPCEGGFLLLDSAPITFLLQKRTACIVAQQAATVKAGGACTVGCLSCHSSVWHSPCRPHVGASACVSGPSVILQRVLHVQHANLLTDMRACA